MIIQEKLPDELIKKIDTDGLREFCDKNGVLVLYVFGSQLTGDNDEFSDLDLGVVFLDSKDDKVSSVDFYMNFKKNLAKFFDFNEIDLLFMQKTGIKINFKIVTQGKVLYSSNKEKRLNFEDMIVCRGLDFKGEMKLYYQELKETIIEGDTYGG